MGLTATTTPRRSSRRNSSDQTQGARREPTRRSRIAGAKPLLGSRKRRRGELLLKHVLDSLLGNLLEGIRDLGKFPPLSAPLNPNYPPPYPAETKTQNYHPTVGDGCKHHLAASDGSFVRNAPIASWI